ncbi:hypothetical protein HN51_040390 [Arachis hypogaea]|nr:ATPase 5, plasma membrane-type-like [Arachis ipaensis]XP_025657563.1 ATPase 5, plasma membrane-type [Arachis hypogaea]
MCVSLFDLATSACSSPCVAAFLSSILPQLCRTENQDDIDAVIVGVLVDPKEARAGIREVHFFPFNPGDKRTALTYIESDGNWHISSKGAPEQILNLCNYKEDVKRKAMQLLLSLLSVGSDLWGLLDSFGST